MLYKLSSFMTKKRKGNPLNRCHTINFHEPKCKPTLSHYLSTHIHNLCVPSSSSSSLSSMEVNIRGGFSLLLLAIFLSGIFILKNNCRLHFFFNFCRLIRIVLNAMQLFVWSLNLIFSLLNFRELLAASINRFNFVFLLFYTFWSLIILCTAAVIWNIL